MGIDFLRQPFHLLDRKSNRWLLIVAVGVFAILFMNLYLPFNVNEWYKKETTPLFIILSSFGLIGMVVLAVSQLFIREIFQIRRVKLYGIILWFLVELILLTLTMYFIYGDTKASGQALISELYMIFKYTVLVVIIPYVGVLFYLYNTQKGENIDKLLSIDNRLVNILDENGDLHLALDLNQLIFIQSADNYVEVNFLKGENTVKELVRTSLKKLETELDEFPIRRCHRSYMVNINKIAVSTKSNKGLSLVLKDCQKESIPVSSNYTPFFMRLMKQKDSSINVK